MTLVLQTHRCRVKGTCVLMGCSKYYSRLGCDGRIETGKTQ